MTVAITPPIKIHTYTGTGTYGNPFVAFDEETIQVSLSLNTGAVIDLVYLTDFTVAILPENGGVNVVVINPAYDTTGLLLTVSRVLPLEQTTEWDNGSALDMPLQTRSFDKVVMMMQQVSAAVSSATARTNWRGVWATGVDYEVSDIIFDPVSGNLYISTVAHTSGIFATDLSGGNWFIALDTSVVADTAVNTIVAEGLGGMVWSIKSVSSPTAKSQGHLYDTTTATKTATLHSSPQLGDLVAVGDLKGTFKTNNCTIARNGGTIQGVASDYVLNKNNSRIALLCVVGGATPEWIIISETNLVEGGGGLAWKPFDTNQITVNGEGIAMDTTGGAKTITVNATPEAEETFGVADQKGTFQTNACTLAFTGIKLHGVVQTSDMVLDVKNQRVVFSYISADTGWIITELEPSALATPYNYTVPGLNLTGNVIGFDVIRKSNTEVTISKGWTLDSTGMVPLALTADTDVTLQTGANTLSHLFVCRLLNGNITAKSYASEAAAAADTATINAFRWIDYWVNTGGGSIAKAGATKDGVKWWERFSENTINSSGAVPANITTAIDISSFLPVSRVSEVLIGGLAASSAQSVSIGNVAGTASDTFMTNNVTAGAGQRFEWGYQGKAAMIQLLSSNIYWGLGGETANSNAQLAIHAVKLRR
jgi:hypothetical protein